MSLTPSSSVTLSGVVSKNELDRCLRRIGQTEWCTNVRLHGLLLIIDYVCRCQSRQGVSIPADLAHGYISNIKRTKSSGTIREPLAVLCKAGILRCVRAAVNSCHVKKPAAYAFDDKYCNRRMSLKVLLPAKLANKRQCALQRCEERLNKKYPYRKTLRSDLDKLSFISESRPRISQLLGDPNFEPSTKRALEAVDGRNHWVKPSASEQITTSITGCPRELKEHLLLAGESIAFCDISHAHHCFLPRLLIERIKYIKQKHEARADVSPHETELTRLIAFLSNGDYYQKWCKDKKDEKERNRKKKFVNMLLNSPNDDCEANRLYRYMRRLFPITFGICEAIKNRDHRNISKQLQHHTAEAINGALLEAQSLRIPAIPDVDAIICPLQHRETVCKLIGKHVYTITGGVCCKVGGLRYTPVDSYSAALTESTQGESSLKASASELDPDVIAPGSICLTECIPHVAITAASMGTAMTSKALCQ